MNGLELQDRLHQVNHDYDEKAAHNLRLLTENQDLTARLTRASAQVVELQKRLYASYALARATETALWKANHRGDELAAKLAALEAS
jgi:hypothetical protein